MGRNFYQSKNYQWTENDNYIGCSDGDFTLFHIAREGRRDELLNAYMAGLHHGTHYGKANLADEIRKLLGIKQDADKAPLSRQLEQS